MAVGHREGDDDERNRQDDEETENRCAWITLERTGAISASGRPRSLRRRRSRRSRIRLAGLEDGTDFSSTDRRARARIAPMRASRRLTEKAPKPRNSDTVAARRAHW